MLLDSTKDIIVGAVRHVDDFYLGLKAEHHGPAALSRLRDLLARYELYLNDQKTRTFPSTYPINDLWAQRLRNTLSGYYPTSAHERIQLVVDEALEYASAVKSDSPVKILLRSFDEKKIYNSHNWEYFDKNLQRIIQHHPHSIDYACLLVAKRVAIGKEIDKEGWLSVASTIIERNLALNHHHETVWMLWLLVVCDIEVPVRIVESLSGSSNGHIRALLVQSFVDGKINRKPKLALGAPLATTDDGWLVNLVARSQGYSKAKFGGVLAAEFEHLASRHIRLIDFSEHVARVRKPTIRAISRIRYGYDDDDDEYGPLGGVEGLGWDDDDEA